MKKIVSKYLIFICIITLAIPAVQVEAAAKEATRVKNATTYANEMEKLGINVGNVNAIKFDKSMNKLDGIKLIIQLFGKNEDAKKTKYDSEMPLSDVSKSSKPYVAYAYTQGWIEGISKTKFGSKNKMTTKDFITIMLRTLNYSSDKDFSSSNSLPFAEKISLLKEEQYTSKTKFIQADAYIIFYQALNLKPNNNKQSLKDLISEASEAKPVDDKPEPKPTEEPEPTEEPKPTEVFVNTKGEGNKLDAGVFRNDDSKLITVNKDADYDTNFSRLNGMIGKAYGFSYMPTLTQTGTSGTTAKFLYDEDTNRYGVEVFEWRQSYHSNTAENKALNCVLETFYFLSGDKEVSYALWSFIDAANINDYANTDDFGFRDTATFKNGFSAIMNGVEVDITYVNKKTTIYFK